MLSYVFEFYIRFQANKGQMIDVVYSHLLSKVQSSFFG